MAEPSNGKRARYPSVALLVTGGIGVLLLSASFLIRVRVVVEQPAVGDVTPLVRIVWRTVLGIATLGSFALGMYDVVAGLELRRRREKRFEISGDDNDVDLHVHVTGVAGLTGTVTGDERGPEVTTGTNGSPEADRSEPSPDSEADDVDPPGDG